MNSPGGYNHYIVPLDSLFQQLNNDMFELQGNTLVALRDIGIVQIYSKISFSVPSGITYATYLWSHVKKNGAEIQNGTVAPLANASYADSVILPFFTTIKKGDKVELYYETPVQNCTMRPNESWIQIVEM